MRWWLALVFAGIAALTAVLVAEVFYARTETSIRERTGELAAGTAVGAATRISQEESIESIRSTAEELERTRQVALFVLDRRGRLLTPERSRGVSFTKLPNHDQLAAAAEGGTRLVDPIDGGRSVTVVLPIRNNEVASALVLVAARPDLQEALGIARNEIVSAALWATAAGALAGLGVALLITRRIRRIAAVAAAIEEGEFDLELRPRFRDELGDLAATTDRMGKRLAASFALLESDRARLERLLEQLQEGVVTVDRQLTVEFANARATELAGETLAPGDPLPDPWGSVSIRALAAELFGPLAQVTTTQVHPDPTRTIVVTALPPSAGGSSAVLVFVDATERQRRERAEREFVTNAAHELRTPLAAITSAVDALQSGAKDDPAARDRFLTLVERQTSRLGGLVRSLLALARAETGEEHVRLEPFVVAPLLADVVADTTGHELEIAVDVAPGVGVLGHRDLLRQALGNLVRNAATHGKGASIRLDAYPAPDGRVSVRVSDQGPGMTRAEATRVFDRFYRAGTGTVGGYGLGLAIVSAAIGAMNGEISVDTSPGGGMTVTITLERAPVETAGVVV